MGRVSSVPSVQFSPGCPSVRGTMMASIPGWQDLWKREVGADAPLAPVLCAPFQESRPGRAARQSRHLDNPWGLGWLQLLWSQSVY